MKWIRGVEGGSAYTLLSLETRGITEKSDRRCWAEIGRLRADEWPGYGRGQQYRWYIYTGGGLLLLLSWERGMRPSTIRAQNQTGHRPLSSPAFVIHGRENTPPLHVVPSFPAIAHTGLCGVMPPDGQPGRFPAIQFFSSTHNQKNEKGNNVKKKYNTDIQSN